MTLVLLDRDGVINFDSDAYIKSPDEWLPIPGALEAISELTKAGCQIAVVTNQSGIARGYYDETILTAIHAKMLNAVDASGGKIDAIYYCPHHPSENCLCRKPKPGLLLQAARDFNCDLRLVPFIGDKLSDIEAAVAAGAIPYFIHPAKSDLPLLPKSTRVFSDLMTAVHYLLSQI